MPKTVVLRVFILVATSGLSQNTLLAQQKPDRSDTNSSDSISPAAEVPAGQTGRYIVPFMNSQTTSGFRSATVVTIHNNSAMTCSVSVDWFPGFSSSLACTTSILVAPGLTVDHCSRLLPTGVTSCNVICAPALTFTEGRARVASTADAGGACANLAISARLYHLSGTTSDTGVNAVASLPVVRIGQGNSGN